MNLNITSIKAFLTKPLFVRPAKKLTSKELSVKAVADQINAVIFRTTLVLLGIFIIIPTLSTIGQILAYKVPNLLVPLFVLG